MGWGLRFFMSAKLPGDTTASGPSYKAIQAAQCTAGVDTTALNTQHKLDLLSRAPSVSNCVLRSHAFELLGALFKVQKVN